MKRSAKFIVMSMFLTVCLLAVTVENSSSEEYGTLKGLKSIKAVFDFGLGNPQGALISLQVIQQTFKDKNMWVSGKKPEIAVIFVGPSVKLVSKSRSGFKEEDQKTLDEIAGKITEMAKDGINFEICLIAMKILGVEPSSILPEIKQVGNGWISLIGHEAKGYHLVPVSP
jgi:intracellular sulfur oxidation DsrE/DsrF family protein